MDSSRSPDPRLYQAAQPRSTYPYADGQQPVQQRPAPRPPVPLYPYGEPSPQPALTHEHPAPRQPDQQHRPQAALRPATTSSTARRLLGVLVFLALTALSMPIHIAAVFFVYVTFESPGDAVTAALIVSGAFIGSFAALFVTGLLAQLAGGFPGRWRARVTFAVLSGVLALGSAYLVALAVF